MTIHPNSSDAFWTPIAGIYRHDNWGKHSPSRYFVCAKPDVAKILDFFCLTDMGWNHREAVVDDFGNLVAVPS